MSGSIAFSTLFTILVCVCSTTAVVAYMQTAATDYDEDNEPTLNLFKGQACENYSSSVQRFSSDIWMLQQNYSLCGADTLNEEAMVLKFSTETVNTTERHSVIFAAESNGILQSWQLPFKPEYDETSSEYEYSRRTICQLPSNNDDHNELVLSIFTGSNIDVKYSIEIEPVENFIINLTNSATFNVSFSEPKLHYFKFPDDVDSVLVEANANSKNTTKCAIVSIQNASCPVNDQLDNARAKGMWQTMTSSASLVVTPDSMGGSRDFFIVVIAASSDICQKGNHYATTKTTDSNNTVEAHQITLSVKKLEPLGRYLGAILVPLAVFTIIGGVIFIVMCIPNCCNKWAFNPCWCIKNKCVHCDERCVDDLDDGNEAAKSDDENTPLIKSVNQSKNINGEDEETTSISEKSDERKKLVFANTFKGDPNDLDGKYHQYKWIVFIIGVYYALPAVQLVYSEGIILSNNGDQDLCYYNFKCPHPFTALGLNSFNNVWSNIGYVILGLFFLAIVAWRSAIVAWRNCKTNKKERKREGVPQFFGIYYAMGVALIMEGVMSSFYHICPSNTNFQFDTAFMFIIGGLLIVKMLQARHPDIHANACIAFVCLAIVTLFTLLGIWEWSKPYWETKLTLGILACMGVTVFSVSLYYFHDWTISSILNKIKAKCCNPCNTCSELKICPKYKFHFCKIVFRMVLLVLVNGAVVAVFRKEIIATIVLYLLIINFAVLLVWYLFWKVVYCERFTLMSCIYLLLLIGFWIPALIYFEINVTSRETSPALSRSGNQYCYLAGFYDQHDVWHFLSAIAMFFTFMFLLTIDDGTKDIDWEDLHVF